MLNRINDFVDQRGISRYRFWQDTSLGRDTAYRLYNYPSYIPTGAVLDKICSTYKMQPGEFLEWREESPNEEGHPIIPEKNHSPTGSLNSEEQLTQGSQSQSKEVLTLIEGGLPIIAKKVS